jgi:hypothetical protein
MVAMTKKRTATELNGAKTRFKKVHPKAKVKKIFKDMPYYLCIPGQGNTGIQAMSAKEVWLIACDTYLNGEVSVFQVK